MCLAIFRSSRATYTISLGTEHGSHDKTLLMPSLSSDNLIQGASLPGNVLEQIGEKQGHDRQNR